MRRFFAVIVIACLAAGCKCPQVGPCDPVDYEGWTSIFASWRSHDSCDDCCPYPNIGACAYVGPPGNPRGLYRYSDEPPIETLNAPPVEGGEMRGVEMNGGQLDLDPELVPPPPSMDAEEEAPTRTVDLRTE